MKNISVVFFGMAICLAALWGVLEIVLAKDAEVKNPSCTLSGHLQHELAGQKILDKIDFQLWAFSQADEALRSFRVSTDKTNYSVNTSALIPLRCGTPDYQCIATVANGGPEHASVIAKNANSLLIATQNKKKLQILPALIADDHLKISGPLKMCGQIPSLNPSQYFQMANRVAYFDPYSSRLGLWAPRYTGAVVNEAPHEPEEIFQLARSGFEPANCQTQSRSSVAQIYQVADKIILFAAVEGGSIVKSYSVGTGFVPEEIAPLEGLKVESIWPLSWNSIVVKTTSDPEPAVLRWNMQTLSWSLLPLHYSLERPLNKFASLNAEKTLGISSRYFLASENIFLSDNEKALTLPSESRQWRRTEIEDSVLFEGAEQSFVWARQRGENIQLYSYQCH